MLNLRSPTEHQVPILERKRCLTFGHFRKAISSAFHNSLKALRDALSGGDPTHFWKQLRDGTWAPTQVKLDLDDFLEHFCPGRGAFGVVHFCHRCDVEADENGALPLCCADPVVEGPQKAYDAWYRMVISRGWAQSAESKWTSTTLNCRRLCLVVKLLGHVCDVIKAQQKVRDADEAMLAAELAANREDHAARNKLTLLRSARAFNSPAAQAKLAIVVTVMVVMDGILYALLGCDLAKRPPISMLDMVDRTSSPVLKALETLGLLMEEFSHDVWSLLGGLSVDHRNHEVRDFARRCLWGARVGLLDHYELRFQRPPYTIVAARDKPELLAVAVTNMLEMPIQCLPLSCQKVIRMLGHDRRAILRHAPAIFEKVLSVSPATIHFSEGQHALVRQDVASDGQPRSFTSTSHRTLCKLVKAEHVRRGGLDPVGRQKDVLSLAVEAQFGQDAVGAHAASPNVPTRPAGAFIAYQNERQASFKEMIGAAHRPLTEAERQRCTTLVQQGWEEVRIWQWSAMHT